jgi:signal transduction histidine kinase/CheY-like chemotaxis protein
LADRDFEPRRELPFGLDLSLAVFDRATRIARALFPGGDAFIVLMQDGEAWSSRPYIAELSPGVWGPQLVIDSGEQVWIEDGRLDARACQDPLVTGPPYLRGWVGTPIRLEDGSRPGLLSVAHTDPQPYDRIKAARLKDLTDFVADEWARAKSAEAEREAARAVELAQMTLEAALEAAERTEERLNIALTLTDVHVWEMDYANRKLFKAGAEDTFFEAPQTYEKLYSDIFGVIDARDRPTVAEAWRRYVEEGVSYAPQYRIHREDGREVWAEGAIRLFNDGRGKMERVVGAIRNITAAKQTERRLMHAIEAAEAANRAKSQFLATMSHEIRTPLNGVLGMAQAMESDELTDAQRGRLGVIRDSGRSLLAILDDVLDISKIEAGKLQLDEAEFDIEEIAESACQAFAALAETKDLTLALKVARRARGRYLGDVVRVRQVLYNLISNAVKFTGQGGVTVRVSRADGWLKLSVRDTGVGIDPQDMQRLFEKFEQADATTTRRYGGSGLGLAICRELAELMGGWIEAQSEVGKGATFAVRLRLPRVGPARRAKRAAADTAPEATPTLRILAAEDNLVNQLVLKTLLGQVGLTPTIVADGAAALDAWEREPWDLVLMDVQMPRMDGPTAARAIRRREGELGRPRTPILALTANAMAHQLAEYRAAGMDGLIAKPIEVAQLFAALDEAVNAAPEPAPQRAAG